MDADRRGESMTDRVLNREIQALFAVDPSPDFPARVRTRVAGEPEPSVWWMTWRFAAVCAAAAAAVAIAIAVARPQPADPVPFLTARTLANSSTAMADLKGEVHHAIDVGRSQEPILVGRTLENHSDGAAVEVLIDPRETAALRALILGARDGRIDLEPALHASRPTAMELPPIRAIAIAPITIEPLVEEGVRQ